MAGHITRQFHRPIALIGWCVFLAKPIYKLLEFLDDIDFLAQMFNRGDLSTRGWMSAGIEFLDTGWGTLSMSLIGVGMILLASYRKPGRIYLTRLAEENPVIKDQVYENRKFVGPAVIHFGKGNVLNDSSFLGDPNRVLIEAKRNDFVGVVTFTDCMFKRCQFKDVGIIGQRKALAENFRKDSKVVWGF